MLAWIKYAFKDKEVVNCYNSQCYINRLKFIKSLDCDKDELIKDGVVDGNLFVTHK